MNIFSKLFSKKVIYNGVKLDTRPQAERAKDWQATEIASAAAMIPVFREVKEGKWLRYTVRNQNGSGTCVAQTLAKIFEVIRKLMKGDTIVFSATPFFQKRANKPQTGMHGADALNIAVKTGTCRESACPSQLMTDAQIDSAVLPANFEELNNEVDAVASLVLPNSFDYVAAAIEKWGAVMIHVNTDYNSWSRDFPKVGGKKGEVVHSIAGVDAFTFNGTQYILIEDSWGEFGQYKGQRLLSREAFNDMVFFAGAVVTFTFDIENDAKKFAAFNTIMEYGQRSNEIARLQDYLKTKGCFPSDQQSTGMYGNITALAVLSFQQKYNVASPIELAQVKGKRVGAKTLAAINKNL
jgi:hypothetical protein